VGKDDFNLWCNCNLGLEIPTEYHPDIFGKYVRLFLVFICPYALFSRLIVTAFRQHSVFPRALVT